MVSSLSGSGSNPVSSVLPVFSVVNQPRDWGSNGVESELLTIGGRFTTEATESTEEGRRKAATVGSMDS